MATIKVPSLPVVNTGDKQLDRWLAAVNQIVRAREGMGDGLDRLVTMRDLLEGNIAGVVVNGQEQARYLGTPIPPLPGGVQVKQIDYTPPPAISGLTASGALQNVIISWDLPLNSNYAHAEVWRADSNSIGAAIKIGTSAGTVYVDAIGESSVTRYYWCRQLSDAGILGPFNATSGVSASTAQIGATDIGPNSISTGMIQANAITSDEIAAGQVIAGKIATNAVTANNIQSNSITSTKIAADQVTATHMAANSITASNAAIANLAVTNAKIANLAVSTLKIQDQAVSIPIGSHTSSQTTIYTFGTTVQSAYIYSSGAPIHILFSCAATCGGSTSVEYLTLRVTRNGSTIWSTQYVARNNYQNTAYSTGYNTVSVSIEDQPGAGGYTYAVVMSAVVGAATSRAYERSLLLLEVKK